MNLTERAVDRARDALGHVGITLGDEGAQAMREWVAAQMLAGVSAETIEERVTLLIDAIIAREDPATPVDGAGLEAAIEAHGLAAPLPEPGEFTRLFPPVQPSDEPGRDAGARAHTSGTVKWFNDEKGFGFIVGADGGDVFVHHSSIADSITLRDITLRAGDAVEFDVVDRLPGPTAENVEAVGRRRTGRSPGFSPRPEEEPTMSAPPPAFEHEAAPPPSEREATPPPTSEMEATPPPSELEATSPPPAEREAPPRSAYALVEAPHTVVAGTEFDARIGLAGAQSPGVIGDALVLPESTVYPYLLTLHVVAEGLEVVDGAWRRDVTATAQEPFPSTVFRLRATPQTDAVTPAALQVIYSIAGQTIGFAVRPLAILRTATDQAPAPPAEDGVGVDMAVPTDRVAPDLTIHILRDPNMRERLLWTLESPHAAVAAADDGGAAIRCDIGDQPRDFAKHLVQQVNLQEGKATLPLQLRGIGNQIAEKVPQPIWDAVHAAAEAVGGPPTILLLSEEPYVPWELAVVPDPLPVPDAPRFLGAQAHVGRWVLGQRTPTLPPPHELDVQTIAVVWGEYNSSRWARLEGAEREAAALQAEYGAESVDAKIDAVVACLGGTPAAHALHFAIHGVYSPGGVQDGLVLIDGETISPTQIRGANLAQRPFVFLNACQVGSSQEVLGDYAGMAAAFLSAHASAVIAPLWSVKDTIARDISLEVYRDAFGGEPLAAVLRRQRALYSDGESATYLAYQYFGHPELRLHRTTTPNLDRTHARTAGSDR